MHFSKRITKSINKMPILSIRYFSNIKDTNCIGIIGVGNLGQSLTTMILNGKKSPISLICSVKHNETKEKLA